MTITVPAPEIERSSWMPWIVLICSSSFCATWVSISSVDAQAHPARGADDDERHDEHGREDRALDADFGELLHVVLRDHVNGLTADQIPGLGHHGVAALEAVDDLDVLAEPAAGRYAHLGRLALTDQQHLLDAGEHDDGAPRHRHPRLARPAHYVAPR